ncbi:hypothetical protein AAF712_000158 [Marasmius tenuissimus]|uniref:Transglutaminase-like domain-containing protein n=1 Tax=Marasmius tenuissimus TaxID=585030 RepID=A0ABR3AFT3_9AGAR|nr:hypothetical protein PM082_000906 [Marasmius tenuissimus]
MALHPPPRKAPPPPPRRASSILTKLDDEEPEENQKPLGIAARIANLRLNQVGVPPTNRLAREPEPVIAPVVDEPIQVDEDVVDEPVGAVVRAPQPTWEEIESRGAAFVRAVRREPPPIPGEGKDATVPPPLPGRRKMPPIPARLPTPPPEPEPEPETQEHDPYSQSNEAYGEEEQTQSCIKCHDFSFIDDHAAQFPRHTVTSLDQLAYDLTSPWTSETEKFRALFTWLHHNVAYDAQAFFSGNLRAATPESTFQSGLAVCDGYAGLFTSLAERAGLQAYKVSGHGKGFGYVSPDVNAPSPPFDMNHAWNCALMDGDWRLIDSCWGAGHVDGAAYHPKFNPSWFISSNAEFGKRHYPEDPGYQLLTDEEGGAVSWEDYIMVPEGPVIFTDFHDQNFSPHYLQPDVKYVQGGSNVSFHLFKHCEHMSTADADNYVFFLNTPGDTRTPLRSNTEGGWSATVYIPPGAGGEVSIFYVKEVNGQDAKGLGVQGFNASMGRTAMAFGGLCRWTVT